MMNCSNCRLWSFFVFIQCFIFVSKFSIVVLLSLVSLSVLYCTVASFSVLSLFCIAQARKNGICQL